MNLKRILLVTGLMLSAISCNRTNDMRKDSTCLVFAHRGASGYALENTMSSFKKAAELNVKAVELDVFRCLSGEIVVFHDEDLSRLSDRNEKIEELTFEQLRSIRLNDGQQIPSLVEVLDFYIHKDVLINVELKGLNTAQGVHDLILSYGLSDSEIEEKLIISSFEREELSFMRKINNQMPIAVLTAEDPIKSIEFGRKINAKAINPNAADVSFSNVKALHEAGFKVYAWTVNNEGLLKSLLYSGIDGVFCDYPDKAMKWVKEILTVPAP